MVHSKMQCAHKVKVIAMDTLAQVVAALGYDYSPDFWYDQAKGEVGALLDQLDDAQWARLAAMAPAHSPAWRIHLVEASLHTEQPRAVRLLVKLLAAPEPEVGVAVAEMLLEKNYRWTPAESLLADLHRHLQAAAPDARAPIQRLLDRLPA